MKRGSHGYEVRFMEILDPETAGRILSEMDPTLAASVIGIFFVPAIFTLVEKWSGAGKEHVSGALPATPAPAEGD